MIPMSGWEFLNLVYLAVIVIYKAKDWFDY